MTLIEAVLYISVALALIVGGLVFYDQASLISRVNYVARAYAAAIAEFRVLAEESKGFAGSAHQLLYQRGAIPEDLWDANEASVTKRFRAPFPDMFTAMDGHITPTGQHGVALRIWNVNVRACSRLAVTSAGGRLMFADGFSWASVRETTGANETTWFKSPTFSGITPSMAATACRHADANRDGKVFLQVSVSYN